MSQFTKLAEDIAEIQERMEVGDRHYDKEERAEYVSEIERKIVAAATLNPQWYVDILVTTLTRERDQLRARLEATENLRLICVGQLAESQQRLAAMQEDRDWVLKINNDQLSTAEARIAELERERDKVHDSRSAIIIERDSALARVSEALRQREILNTGCLEYEKEIDQLRARVSALEEDGRLLDWAIGNAPMFYVKMSKLTNHPTSIAGREQARFAIREAITPKKS